MRLSMVFELLLIFLLVAFAAYARVIDRDEAATVRRVLRAVANSQKQSNVGVSTISLKQATDNVNKYCTCNDNICNCCRDFNIPVVQLKGPGCASVQYLKGDNMALQLSFGDNILTSTVVNGKSPKPVCVPLPGGFSKFCGRIYSIQREAADHFKACLGLELSSSNQVEASLRVSCFRFGPDGLKLRPAEPLPVVESDSNSSDDDDDDEDDIFGLGSDDDDEEDDDDDDEEDDAENTPTGNAVPSSSANDDDDDDDEDDDVLGLGSLFDIFGDDDAPSKKPKVTTPIPPISIPLLTKPITSDAPIVVETSEPAQSGNDIPVETTQEEPSNPVPEEESPNNNESEINSPEITAEVPSDPATVPTVDDPVPLGSVIEDNVIQPAASSVQEEYVLKPGKDVNKIKPEGMKKPTVTSSSVNAIPNDAKKPVPALKPKPLKPDPVKNEAVESSEDEDDEDEEEDILDDDDDDEEEEEEVEELGEDDDDDDDKKDESIAEDEDDDDDDEKKPGSADSEEEEESIVDDDDDSEEDELITAIAGDEAKGDKISTNEAADPEADDPDYGLGLAEMLARKRNQRHMRPSGRQSKVMRL